MRLVAVAWVLCSLAASATAQEAITAPPAPTHSAQPQGDAGRDKTAAQPQSAPPAPIIINIQPPAHTEAEAQKEERERQEKANLDRRLVELTGDLADYTKYLAWATFALFAVTAGLFAFAIRQASDAKEAGKAARESANAAKRSADAAEIALVGAEPPFLYPVLEASPPNDPAQINERNTIQSVINVGFGNIGRSPGIVQFIDIKIIPVKDFPDPVPIAFSGGLKINCVVPQGVQQTLYKIVLIDGLDKIEIDGERPRHAWMLLVRGFVLYDDLAGQQFATRVCYSYNPTHRIFSPVGGPDHNGRYKLSDEEKSKIRSDMGL